MVSVACWPYGLGDGSAGVCLLVEVGARRILLDCGLADISPLEPRLPEVDLVLCSHAHADHSRGLLALHYQAPQIPIYASEVTVQLLGWDFCRALPWRTPVEFQEGLSAVLIPAGHLPGAAVFCLSFESLTEPPQAYSLMYTGDFLLSNTRLVDGLRLEELRPLRPDVLILEGSHGTARHLHRRQQENHFAERVSLALAQGQSVMLPLPALGLAQEVLMILRSHHLFTGRDLDIWVDPTIAAMCDAYVQILPQLPSAVQNFARHQSLFWDQKVRPRIHRQELQGGSGSAPGVFLLEKTSSWLAYCRQHPRAWLILLPERPGYPVLSLERAPGGLETYLLSEHTDAPGTTQLIHNLRPRHVVLVHGTPEYLGDLAGLEELYNRYQVHLPRAGALLDLPLVEEFHQPPPTLVSYEGELTELETMITITLPSTITSDTRWAQFADTGLVEAHWQGDDLVLKGLSQRDFLIQSSTALWREEGNTCANCQHYRSQRCWNQASPLSGLRVSGDGYCPAHARRPPPP